MREIIFDTETTGLDPGLDRIIEFGALELVNRFPTGRTFHFYLDPQGRAIHPEAQAIHGISAADLVGKPRFDDIAAELAEFLAGCRLVAHNAMFDIGFLNAEFARLGYPAIPMDVIVDTLAIARRRHPLGPNSLDALCRRYGIDNSHRTMHGALLDSELLSEVYIELMGGRQATLSFEVEARPVQSHEQSASTSPTLLARPRPLPSRLDEAQAQAHAAMVEKLGEDALWLRLGSGRGA